MRNVLIVMLPGVGSVRAAKRYMVTAARYVMTIMASMLAGTAHQ
jgi:hypothetical protein